MVMISEGNGTGCHTQRAVATSLPANLSLEPNTGTEAFLLPPAWLLSVSRVVPLSLCFDSTFLSCLFQPPSPLPHSVPSPWNQRVGLFLFLERCLNCSVTHERTSAVCRHTPSWVSLPLCSVIRAAVVDMRPALIRLQRRT